MAFNELVTRLKRVNDVIKGLDEAIRADAFLLLRPYVESRVPAPAAPEAKTGAGASSQAREPDLGTFLESRSVEKPSDALYLLAAYHFSQFGSAPFSVDEVRQIADSAGLTVPKRIDMTFESAKRDSKDLFRRAGRNQWAPTVAGELWMKATYGVTKGTKPKPEAAPGS